MKYLAQWLSVAALFIVVAVSSGATTKTLKEVQKFTNSKEGIIGWNGNIYLADVNGDGYKDLIARYSKNSKLIGGIWLWRGNKFSDSVDCSIDLSLITETNIYTGDLNGDGKADLIFLSQYSSYHPPKVVFGRSTWPATITKADLVCGPAADDSLFAAEGQYASMAVGDFNDDGFDDIIYQIQGDDTASTKKGLIGGRLIMYNGGNPMDSIPDWIYRGAQTYPITGTNKSITVRYMSPWHMDVGDFNGDGKIDLLTSGWNSYSSISLYNNQGVMQSMYNCGAGMVFLGGADFDTIPDVILMASDKWLRYTTPSIYLWLGYGVYNAGDINGDGIDDISLPGWYIDLDLVYKGDNTWQKAANANSVLVVRDEAFAYTKNRMNFAGYADQHGANLVSIGDVNGDGLSDLAVTRNFFGGMLSEERGIDFFFTKPDQSGIIKPDFSTDDYIQVMPLTIDFDGDGINEFFAYDQSYRLTILKVLPISLTGIQDVVADQGGYVKLSWNSTLDNDVERYSYFSIWRSTVQDNNSASSVSKISQMTAKFTGRSIIETSQGNQIRRWEWVKNVPAALMSNYTTTVPTLYDSSSVSNGLHYFMVIAHTSDPNKFYMSEVDSGYSKDNLAPKSPSGLIAKNLNGVIRLSWSPNTESDLAQYAVYKSNNQASLMSAPVYAYTTDTSYTDPVTLSDGTQYYMIRAIDVHGNLSSNSDIAKIDGVTSVIISGSMPLEYSLSQNYPNPFNPTTTIQYSIKEAGNVSLKVINILGEIVAELENGYKSAGRYDVKFDASKFASGIYYYQLTSGTFTKINKMILLK